MLRAVIFDLDGVILSTDDFHYRAWKQLADREGIYFDRAINERLRGVSRMDSLAIILERAGKKYSQQPVGDGGVQERRVPHRSSNCNRLTFSPACSISWRR